MRLKSVSFKIAILFLVFTAVFTLFRSSMSGIFFHYFMLKMESRMQILVQ